MIGRSAAV